MIGSRTCLLNGSIMGVGTTYRPEACRLWQHGEAEAIKVVAPSHERNRPAHAAW
jgi:hypothetical protein